MILVSKLKEETLFPNKNLIKNDNIDIYKGCCSRLIFKRKKPPLINTTILSNCLTILRNQDVVNENILKSYLSLQPLLTSRCDSDPVFYVHQGHLPTHMQSLRLSRHTDQRLTRHAPARVHRLLVTGGVVGLFLVSVLCFLVSLYYWENKGYDAPPSLEDPESKVSTANKVSLILSVLLFNLSKYLDIYKL